MNKMIITLDLDWAAEAAIEETLSTLENMGISPTVFITHRSKAVEKRMDSLEVGLHPYFDESSSHGRTIDETVAHIMSLPHNLKAYRCHRFQSSNLSDQAMVERGMLISSNVCTDLEVIPPFKNRFGILEVPIFMEDGGCLWRNHPLEGNNPLQNALRLDGIKVLLIHPMHFMLNTPDFSYMASIKKSLTRYAWNHLSLNDLENMRWKGRGIRDLCLEILTLHKSHYKGIFRTLGSLL